MNRQCSVCFYLVLINLIFLYPWGPYLVLVGNFSIPDLIQVVLHVFFLSSSYMRREILRFHSSLLSTIIYFLSLSLSVSTFCSKDISSSFSGLVQYQFILWLFIPLGVISIRNIRLNVLFDFFINFYLLLYMLGILFNVFGLGILIRNEGTNRFLPIWLSGFHFNVLSFGYFLIKLTSSRRKILPVLGILASATAIILTGSRTSIVSSILMLLVYLMFNLRERNLGKVIFLLISFVSGFSIILIFILSILSPNDRLLLATSFFSDDYRFEAVQIVYNTLVGTL